jgi:hypothetical protein
LLVRTVGVTFEWLAGLSLSQRQRSIDSLHAAGRQLAGVSRILDISSKSREKLGTALSAFNLTLRTPDHPQSLSVECAFQGSKVFEHGGPYVDIFAMSSRDAKRDERLQSSGRLTGFRFASVDWPLEPQTAFYDWLYITALMQNPALIRQLEGFSAFSDIEFNPERSVNCQAYAVALYVSLAGRGELRTPGCSRDAFLRIVGGRPVSNARQDDTGQTTLF